MLEETKDIGREDEIDLVDILTVLIKRKNIILWIVVLAVVVSGLYTYFSKRDINHTIKLVLSPSQELSSIDENNALRPSNAQVDIFLNNIRKKLYKRSFEMVNGERLRNYTFKIERSTDDVTGSRMINITLTGKKEKVLESVNLLYNMYNNFEKEIDLKNKNTAKIADIALKTDLNEKTDMLERLKRFISEGKLLTLPQGSETAILNTLSSLISEITWITRTIELNKTVELMEGDFYIVRQNDWSCMEAVNPGMLEDLESYLKPEKSIKRQILPVVVSVFLAFFVGIFMAFVCEFFSREDVKKRLKEAANKK